MLCLQRLFLIKATLSFFYSFFPLLLKVSVRGAQGWATGLALDAATPCRLHEGVPPKRMSRSEHRPTGWLLQLTLQQLMAVN